MSTWVSDSELSSHLGFKILIAGLSEAGKTAVKRIFFMKHQTEQVDSLSATINYERMTLPIKDVPVTIVDLGGQRIFIRRFLSSISPFIFSTVRVFLFVIDVSDKTYRNNAIQYFKSCVEKMTEFSPDARYFVFLHKNDLVRALPNYESVHSQMKEQFQLESDKKVHFLRTTIYRPEEVIDAFGRIIELAMPSIAQSKYVEGRTIGKIEEYAEQFFTVEMQNEVCPKCLNSLVESEGKLICNFCSYKQVQKRVPTSVVTDSTDKCVNTLEKLKTLMMESMDTGTQAPGMTPSPVGTPPAASGSDTLSVDVDKLKALMRSSLGGTTGGTGSTGPSTFLSDAAIEETEKDIVLSSTTASEIPALVEDSPENRVPYLRSFFGITLEESEELVKSGYDRMFENAATVGVPINLLLIVLFKYVPYLSDKGLMLDNFEDKLMKIFFAQLNALVKEEELFETLVFAMKNPDMPIEDIIGKYLKKLRKEKEEEQKKIETIVPHEPERIEPVIVTQPSELDKDIIPLPGSGEIGFKIEKEDINYRMTFYQRNNQLSSNIVSEFVSFRDLMYLLAFEAELPVRENYKEFISQIAPVVHSRLSEIIEEEKKKERVEETPVTHEVIPSRKEIEEPAKIEPILESPLIPILKSQKFYFKFRMIGQRLDILFLYRSQEICQIDISITATKEELGIIILKDPSLSTLITESDLPIFTQIIFSKIKQFKDKAVEIIHEQQETTPNNEEEITDLLEDCLKLLESD